VMAMFCCVNRFSGALITRPEMTILLRLIDLTP
jgi:hypothetical protein